MRHMMVDTEIAIPEVKTGRPGYPFADLPIGGSFFIPATGTNISYWKRKTGFTFTTRKTVENGQSGIRVWRTA
jgi:hypothetical protein